VSTRGHSYTERAHAFARARALAHALDFALYNVETLGAARVEPAVLRATFDELAAESDPAGDLDMATAVVPSRAARHLLSGVVRVLPARNRGRYGEEFAGELAELAEAGLSRWGQLRYGLRLGRRTWSLRATLRAAAPARGGSR